MMKLGTLALATMATAAVASADTIVTMHLVDEKGVGAEAGTITISESKYGLVFTPALRGLAPGLHGFHVHENPSCAAKEKDGKQVPALAAGGHLDPAKTGKHAEPWGDGHLGDLPPLYVAADGTATQRPPGTLKEKWRAVILFFLASGVAANASRMGVNVSE